jgi:hypothetical protein
MLLELGLPTRLRAFLRKFIVRKSTLAVRAGPKGNVASDEEEVELTMEGQARVLNADAFSRWRALRTRARHPRWQCEHAQAASALDVARRELEELGARLQVAQRHYSACRARLRVLEARPCRPGSSEETSLYEREFRELCELRTIRKFSIGKSHIKVWTREIRVTIEGLLYTLGSYQIEIRLDPAEPQCLVYCERSGRRDGLQRHVYGADDHGQFCFGSRRDQIRSLLLEGSYLPAIILILESLGHVNEGEVARVKTEYQRCGSPAAQLGGEP